MAPKAMTFKANSVIYFKGDISDKIYILKSGRISLNSEDIETGQEVRDLIQTGEFFGVKSALGKYPREESAVVLSDAEVIQFTVPEFEQFVAQNTRVIMKMLKVFSNQLRRIHARVSSLLVTEEKTDPESGLYGIGQYYLNRKMYAQALYVFRRYLTYYPSGRFAREAANNIALAEQYAQKYGQGKGPEIHTSASQQDMGSTVSAPSASRAELSGVAKTYYNGVSLFGQNKFQEALEEFKKVAEQQEDEEYTVKALFDIGRCLFQLKQFDAAIRQFSGLIQKYPKLPDLPEALYYIGQCYEAKDEKDRAVGFYKKALTMTSEADPVQRKVKKALRALEESSK
ncbi:MAG: cyclic nucleotide-binding domain-containing protein [Spirochaetales bacterium]